MDMDERTSDLFERIANYPEPPLVPLPEIDDLDSLSNIGLKLNKFSCMIVKMAMAITGFRSFQKQLPQTIEQLLRKCNIRGPGLYAPVISASLALQDDPGELTPIERAATLLYGARNLYHDITTGQFEPDRHQDQVLEMGQYPNLFSTSVILEGKGARVFKSQNITQITVIVARRFYLLNVGELGAEIEISQVIATLNEIVKMAHQNRRRALEPSPGTLTAATRPTQQKIFRKLQLIRENTDSLNNIRHSFLTLCLDLDSYPSSDAEATFMAQAGNYGNRWFHSSLQLVVFGNAKACAICNFDTYLDGNVMMRGAAEIQKRAIVQSVTKKEQKNVVDLPAIIELKWQISPVMVIHAQRDIQKIVDNQQATFEISGIGNQFFIDHHVKPVPAFIIALQMTAKKLIGSDVKITQFMSMSKYRCMDLVTPVVSTPAIMHFVGYIERDDMNFEQARILMNEAIDSQAQVSRNARKCLPLDDIFFYFLLTRKGVKKFFARFITILMVLLLRLSGLFKPVGREILVSHPSIYPEIPVIGRPGIRLPYVKYFGLHYQIWNHKIVITMMPGINWTISNAELVSELTENLKRIQSIIASR